ncbi:cytoskeleton-associated protein 2-like isoform X2 [Salvelinus namaycush]|uniref:Cytoskeleton-associated protein 2-like isoform X2 n=1 Tax=Salvelinus namaycush TaxID=8040 RepID=A0A8U1ER96_SALNM|nr:cytoskeleton-associated protein 2-like isoform X2 [Salvelinus namaycush]
MATVTRKNTNFKKGNKENAKPTSGSTKCLITRVAPTKTVAAQFAPLLSKSNKKEDLGKGEDALKKVKTEQKDVMATTTGNTKRRNTFSQAFLTKQAVRQRKLVADAPKPPATVPVKPVPGAYKGKVVQSKISSFRKPSGLEGGLESKAAAKTAVSKAKGQKPGYLTKSKSVADLPGRDMFKPPQSCQPSRSKSVSNGPPPVSKCPVPAIRRPTGVLSAVPPFRTAPFTTARPSSTRSAMTSKGKELPQGTKPKMTVATDKKVHKIPVASTRSQYRAITETAEERRTKLAEWLASKGKTLKRPPISAVAPPKSKPFVQPEPEVHPESTAVSQLKTNVAPQPVDQEPQQPVDEPEPTVRLKNDQVVIEQEAACASTPLTMNTTLDLLDNSDTDFLPVDPEVRMNDIVVNLRDALEKPSACVDDPNEKRDESEEKMVERHTNKEFEERNESPVNKDVEVKCDVGEGASEQKVRKGYIDEVHDDGDCLMETTPEADGTSVVKYSVKTTPYLQSVKRKIDCEACASGSRRKSTIKDLKFLTPVRRSCRIQRTASRLPGMLTDHDTCVSSLAELVKLDDDANAYIYRRNPALLEDLPDHPKDLERF